MPLFINVNSNLYKQIQSTDGSHVAKIDSIGNLWVDDTNISIKLSEIDSVKSSPYTSILEMCNNVKDAGIKTFAINNYANITDYPSKMVDISATIYPIIEIKKYGSISHVTVRAITESGTPCAINGYGSTTAVYWRDVY